MSKSKILGPVSQNGDSWDCPCYHLVIAQPFHNDVLSPKLCDI